MEEYEEYWDFEAGETENCLDDRSQIEEVGDFRIADQHTLVGVGGYIRKTETYVEIPDHIKRIGEKAFAGCENLMAVNIPDSVTEIDEGAFSCCESLKIIKIPASVKIIRPETFAHCTRLKKVILPDSLEAIQEHAFYRCRSLDDICVASDVRVDETAFELCSPKSRTIALFFPGDIDDEIISGTEERLKKAMQSEYDYTFCPEYRSMADAYYKSDIQILVIDANLLFEEDKDYEKIYRAQIREMFETFASPAFMMVNYEKYYYNEREESGGNDLWCGESYLNSFVANAAVDAGFGGKITDEMYHVVFFSLETGTFNTLWNNMFLEEGDLTEFLENFRRGLDVERYGKLLTLDPASAPVEYLDFFSLG